MGFWRFFIIQKTAQFDRVKRWAELQRLTGWNFVVLVNRCAIEYAIVMLLCQNRPSKNMVHTLVHNDKPHRDFARKVAHLPGGATHMQGGGFTFARSGYTFAGVLGGGGGGGLQLYRGGYTSAGRAVHICKGGYTCAGCAAQAWRLELDLLQA